MAPAHYPDDPYDRMDFEADRQWDYRPQIQRISGNLIPLTMSIRFPATDLPAVVERLREAAKELDGRVVPQSPDDNPNQDESNI